MTHSLRICAHTHTHTHTNIYIYILCCRTLFLSVTNSHQSIA